MAHIALMLPRLGLYGGVEQFAYRLAEALAEEHNVDFICARAETSPPLGVRVVIVGRFGWIKCLKVAWFAICAERARKKGSYDLVIGLGKTWNQDIVRIGGGPQSKFWSLSEKAWSPGLSRYSKKFHRYISPTSWLNFIIEKHQFRSQNTLVCVSETVRQWVLQVYPDIQFPEVIYNLPDLSRFTPTTYEQRVVARAKFDLDMGHIAIATATSNFMLKGTRSLIKAMKFLPSNFKLFIAGGRNTSCYKQLVYLLEIQDRVVFMGKVQDMLSLYRAIDLFALPTYYDACSNSVLEARACGLKVLGSIYDGSSSFLPQHWLINNPSNPQEIASKLLSMSQESFLDAMYIPNNIKAGLNSWVDFIEFILQQKHTTNLKNK